MKTRIAYGYGNGKLYDLGDTIKAALQADMLVREYEKELVKENPQLEITFKVVDIKQ